MSRGLLPEISRKLTQQFADCLQAGMAAEADPAIAPAGAAGPPPAAPPAAAKPVGGIGLGLSALWATIVAFFRRLFGGSETT
jgi:hypothetical protein